MYNVKSVALLGKVLSVFRAGAGIVIILKVCLATKTGKLMSSNFMYWHSFIVAGALLFHILNQSSAKPLNSLGTDTAQLPVESKEVAYTQLLIILIRYRYSLLRKCRMCIFIWLPPCSSIYHIQRYRLW